MSSITDRVWIVLMAALAAGSFPAAAVEPGEVVNLRISDDKQTLTWDAEPLADHYNVYRGYVRELAEGSYGATLDAEIAGTSYADPTVPVDERGFAFFYLVTAANGDGEGSMGLRGDLTERPNTHPWPGFGVAGAFSPLRPWPGVAIHMAVLHTGKILTWQGQTLQPETWIWDPETDVMTTQSVTTDIFCGGHSFLPDGKLLVTGGWGDPVALGAAWSWVFDPTAGPNGWVQGPFMSQGRWYPTNTTLGNGEVIVFGGSVDDGVPNNQTEIYRTNPERFDLFTTTCCFIQQYPRMHLLQDGKIFTSGQGQWTRKLDLNTGVWQLIDVTEYGNRTNGGSVLLPPDNRRVLLVGGWDWNVHDEPTETAEIIDLSLPSPVWAYTTPMHFKRINPNVVLLPDGKVFVDGGARGEDIVDPGHVPTYPTEVYDPATATWTVTATKRSQRAYHSTAALMPDGRVLSAGDDGNATAEIYSPGYLFRGPRPAITGAPASVGYGQQFTVDTPEAASISAAVFMRPGATTHAFDQDQRYVALTFTAGAGSLTVTAPSNPNLAPPGYYMLFILDGDKVPSEAVFVRLQ